MFPRHGLVGGGFIPAQVMLGVTAQESNMWQASRLAVPGETGNPLIGNYYGLEIYNSTPDDDWDVRWDEADCGYGVTQVTDGMRLAGREKPGERALPYAQQRAVALDFTVNIAAGVRILEDKWNQTANAGMKVNNGDPAKLENWFFALWAYNSGFYPDRGDGFWGSAGPTTRSTPATRPTAPPSWKPATSTPRTRNGGRTRRRCWAGPAIPSKHWNHRTPSSLATVPRGGTAIPPPAR